MPADPQPGIAYRQEYLEGEAQDNGEVLAPTSMAQTPAGRWEEVLMTRDTNALEPKVPSTSSTRRVSAWCSRWVSPAGRGTARSCSGRSARRPSVVEQAGDGAARRGTRASHQNR